jgi:type I restriction enzyme S subunit
MEVRPGYKQTEVGVIPEDWNLDSIENVALITTGSKNTQDRVEDGQYPFFVRSQTVERINSCSFDGEAVLTAGDGVGTGKVFHYINGRFDVHQRVYRISNFNDRINGYFFYLYFSTHFYNRIMQMTAKSSVDSVRMDMIARMLVPLPPTRAEQRAIAAALSDVDALLDGLARLIAKKRAVKQAAMQQLLSGQTRLPGFHDAWEVKRLGDYATFLRNGVNSRAELLQDGRVRYLHYGEIHASKDVSLSPDSLPCLPDARAASLDRLRDGDLVFADASEDLAGVSKSVEIRGVGSTQVVSGLHTIAARFDKEVLADGFKGFLQFCPPFVAHLRRLAAGTKVYATNRAHVASVEMPLPTVQEQIAIAAVLFDMGAELAALEARRDKTDYLKQAMMQELLTGKTRLVPAGAAYA